MKTILLWAVPASLLLPGLVMAQAAFVGTWKADLSNIQLPKKPRQYLLSHDVYPRGRSAQSFLRPCFLRTWAGIVTL